MLLVLWCTWAAQPRRADDWANSLVCLTTGVRMATTGVLLVKADTNIVGTNRRICADGRLCGLPSTRARA